MKRTVTLNIAGAKYRMVSDADEEHLQRLAGIVNERIAELGSKASRTASATQLLAVVALGLADDLITAEDRYRGLQDNLRTAITKAITQIDERLAQDDTVRESDG